MALDHDDAVQALAVFLTTYRSKLPVETNQLLSTIQTRYNMEKQGYGGVLSASSPSKPSLQMLIKLIANAGWQHTYTLQDLGLGYQQNAQQTTGFTVDDLMEPDSLPKRRIFVNQDTATLGTTTHEFLHFATSISFSKESKPHKLLYEGPTEYFTRRAHPTLDRSAHYPAEHYVINQLVTQNTITYDKLAAAYFEGGKSAVNEVIAAITLDGQKVYSQIDDQLLKVHGQKL
jgi:hypothetical protein